MGDHLRPESLITMGRNTHIGKTTKLDQIDTVEIVFRLSAEESGTETPGPYSFTLEELTRGR